MSPEKMSAKQAGFASETASRVDIRWRHGAVKQVFDAIYTNGTEECPVCTFGVRLPAASFRGSLDALGFAAAVSSSYCELMCESCLADAETIGEIFPGWRVLRARADTEHMHVGDVAITCGGGPSVVFSKTPTPDPMGGWSDEEIDASSPKEWLAYTQWQDSANGLSSDFQNDRLDARLVWSMVESARRVGYDPEEDEAFELWAIDRVGRLLAGQSLSPKKTPKEAAPSVR